MILPSLRRSQFGAQPPAPRHPTPDPEPAPTKPTGPGVLGYVVVATEGCERCLTNADLTDRETAEREASLWR